MTRSWTVALHSLRGTGRRTCRLVRCILSSFRRRFATVRRHGCCRHYIGTRRRPTVVSGKLPAVERRQVRRNGHFCSAAAVTTVDVADSPPPVASQIKSLGVIIDSYLRFDRQTTTVAKACSLTIIIHALRHVRKLLTDETACTVACSIAARLDYCNARR